MSGKTDAAYKVLPVVIGHHTYAFSVAEVVQVITLPKSAVFDMPYDESGRIGGIFNYKGNVIAVAKTKILGQDETDDDENVTAVILNCKSRLFAVLVNETKSIIDANADSDMTLVTAEMLYYDGSGADDNN